MGRLDLIRPEHVDGYIAVSDTAAIEAARELARLEGVFAGFSTGANLAAARQLLEHEFTGKTAVILACDSGLKYLSTDLWP
jgi:cysteine synthase A